MRNVFNLQGTSGAEARTDALIRALLIAILCVMLFAGCYSMSNKGRQAFNLSRPPFTENFCGGVPTPC